MYCWCIENHVSGTRVVCAVHPAALILWSLRRGDLRGEMPVLALFLHAAKLWIWATSLHTTAANGLYHKCSQPTISAGPLNLLWCWLCWLRPTRLMWYMVQQGDIKSIRNSLQWSSWDPIPWGNKRVVQHPSRSRSMSGRSLLKSMDLNQ